MSVKKVGDWDRAGRLCSMIGSDIKKSNEVAIRQIGLKGERMMVKWIKSQPSIWQPLNEAYVAYKKTQGYSTLMLRRTSTFISKITSQTKYPNVFIGVKRGAFNKEGEELANIAAIMEFGSKVRGIPPRMYLRPVHKMLLRLIEVENLFAVYLLKELQRKYGI